MLRKHIIYNDASNWKFDLKKARGTYLWDSNGKKYLDFSSGWNVTNLGWNHPEISKVIIEQAKKNTYAAMETGDPIQYDLAKLLTSTLPKELTAVGRTTGGMEANEEAIKTAYAFTGRKKLVGFRHMYHGQSLSMMSVCLGKKGLGAKGPFMEGVEQLEFPVTFRSRVSEKEINRDFENKLEDVLQKEDVAAVITEAGIITGWGSTYIAPKGFLRVVRKLTKKYGTLLILDEVGTGFSRCGKLYGMYIENVVPDIVTFAKGFSNGAAAIGAMVTTKEIADKTWEVTNLQSTFGWTPVACAVAKKNLEIHLRDKVWEKSRRDGEYLRKRLRESLLSYEFVGDVRGWGMEIGLAFVKDKKNMEADEELALKVVAKAKEKGLFMLYGDDGNIQLMPPLTIERRDLDRGIEIIVDVVEGLHK